MHSHDTNLCVFEGNQICALEDTIPRGFEGHQDRETKAMKAAGDLQLLEKEEEKERRERGGGERGRERECVCVCVCV